MATLRQLEYLVTIVDEGSFTRAAELLHVTQPGLSHQFRALEREIGGPLLERLPRSVRLTPAGRAMLAHARATLADAQRAVTAGRRATGESTGQLDLVALYSTGVGVLPVALREWRAAHPDVRVHLVEYRRADDLATAMRAGDADVAIGPPPADWDGSVHTVGMEEFVIVTHADDPAGNAKSLRARLVEFADREWVHYTQDSGLADILDKACAVAGFRPRVAVRTEQGLSAISYAATGLGPTIAPANIVPAQFDGLLLRPDPPIRRPLTAYTRAGAGPIAMAFIDILADDTLVLPTHVRRRLRLSAKEYAQS